MITIKTGASVMSVKEAKSTKYSMCKQLLCVLFFTTALWSCVPQPQPTPEESVAQFIAEETAGAIDGSKVRDVGESKELPVRFQRPSYSLLSSDSNLIGGIGSEMSVPVGATITTPEGPQALRTVLRKMAELKNMNVSWANDVNREALVDVTIMPEEDFFDALGQMLRQLDYFFEMQGNTIVVQHKATKKFHIAMPFVATTYSTGMGGDVLGSTENNNMSGTLHLDSSANPFDIWENITTNLDKILEIWQAPAPVSTAATNTGGTPTAATPAPVALPASGLGYYTVDRPIGLITVNAPPSLLAKIENYIDNLKSELYRQISIEAKIIEVTLTSDNTTGVDWSQLLSDLDQGFGMELNFGNKVSSPADQGGKFLTIGTKGFNLFLDAMKQQGHIEVLSNPRISVMNGQPAMISVGENVKYVDNVQSTSDEGVISFTINTASVMSGLGMGVVATIMENDEIILSLTPVISDLQEPIEYRDFGLNQVGLPKVKLKEMHTLVKVKNGEMLVVGGLIDNTSVYDNDYVAGLGEIPGVAGKLFRTDGTVSVKKELIILLRPTIISF